MTRNILRRYTILLSVTVALAALQSLYLDLITSDYAHQIFSAYFFCELIFLGILIFPGLNNRLTRIGLGIVIAIESALFLQDLHISPDEFLMILVFFDSYNSDESSVWS